MFEKEGGPLFLAVFSIAVYDMWHSKTRESLGKRTHYARGFLYGR